MFRGAGDILGSEQAGFIDSVGIDLYLKMLEEEVNKKNNGEIEVLDEEEKEEEVESKPLISVTTHIEDSYVSEDDLKIEIHRKINSIEDEKSFKNIKSELEDRFGKLSDDLIIYMYEEWFEKLVSKLKISNVHQNRNSIEVVFPGDVAEKLDTEEIFMDAFEVSNMFRFISKGSNLVIVLDIIKLEEHPIIYLVKLLNKIYVKFGNLLD